MTVSKQRGDAGLRVCLLHNYRESQQFSMKLYADRLGVALEAQNVTVDRLRPTDVLPTRWRSHWLGDKIDSYVGRFVHYPQLAAAVQAADVYHIIDHGQAHLLTWLDARRTVVTCHDLMLLVLASGRLGRRHEFPVATEIFRGVAALLRRAAAVVADSAQTRDDLVQFVDVDPARIQVIFPGMNQPFAPDSAAREAGRRRWGLDGQLVVLQVGNAFYKNIEACLNVVARLRQRGLPVTFLRGGKRLSPRQLACAEQLGISGDVRDLGGLPDGDLNMLYNTADALLCPSLYEGFGWPPLEAMACGTPVVCSRAGSLDEIAGPAALTADPEDLDHLADHLGAVLTDPALAAGLRQRGIEHAARFDWNTTARQFVDVYQRVRESA
jgi:glycosyltransferase involved in cell wall biosynthesis